VLKAEASRHFTNCNGLPARAVPKVFRSGTVQAAASGRRQKVVIGAAITTGCDDYTIAISQKGMRALRV